MNSAQSSITLSKVSLHYELYHDRTNSLKELVVNTLLNRKYSHTKKTTFAALNNISLHINHGERVGIIGHNGSGKSTLLKVMSRLLVPTQGKISIQGNVQPLIEIGAGFNGEYSGRENIYFNGAMLGFTRKQIKARENEIINFAELGEFIDTPLKYYSSGMAVKLAFTIATMIEPEVLLLDEMLSAGDLEFMKKATQRISSIIDFAKILVLVSHDLYLIEKITTRCLVMDHGSVVFDGPTSEAITYYKDVTEQKIMHKS